jgi:hypothetical protein
MHRLKRTDQTPFEFRGWLFYDSASKYARGSSRRRLEGYIRLYITDLRWVVLECVRFDKQNGKHVVRVLETIEDAIDELATQPLNVVSLELYNDVMRDMQLLTKV